ncbi:MAG: hypothetical protein Q7R95_10465 [bacterium]|nr:hypothetical protein [bacterium]
MKKNYTMNDNHISNTKDVVPKNIFHILEPKIKRGKRSLNSLPITSYGGIEWHYVIKNFYQDKLLEEYPYVVSNDVTFFNTFVYPLIFKEYQWSAYEFNDFIEQNLQSMIQKKKVHNPFFMRALKNKYYTNSIDEKNNLYIVSRKSDPLKYMTHISHCPISAYGVDLYQIMDTHESRSIALLYNYGIPLYGRYLQIKHQCPIDIAIEKIKTIFHEDIFGTIKSNPGLLQSIFKEMAKNSILWGPYMKNKIYMDWQKKFNKIWHVLEIDKSAWWSLDDSCVNKSIIGQVSDMFSKPVGVGN